MILLSRAILGMMVALLFGGCASVPETRFYTLSIPSAPTEMKEALQRSSMPFYIEVMPVTVPDRLARPQLIVRSRSSGQESQIFILEEHRWSSHFNDELRDAFATGIVNQTGAIRETRGASGTYAPEQHGYRVAIELGQFDAIVGDSVQARFSWVIRRSTDGRSAACYAAISEPVDGGIDGVVKGIQRVVSNVVEDISKNLTELDTGNAVTCKPYRRGN
jgi:uncharacterized lipoprotein YmbA